MTTSAQADSSNTSRYTYSFSYVLLYFIGKLGRSRVLVLQEGVEWPSDIAGVVYISVTRVNWMEELRSELRGSGVPDRRLTIAPSDLARSSAPDTDAAEPTRDCCTS